MVRIAKYGLIAVSLAAVGGFLLFGMSFPSYLRTSANSAREAVTETVPIEFELRRTRDLIDAVLPDLQSQVRIIAQEEVAIAGLESEISKDEKRLDVEQATLLSLRNQMRAQQASFEVSGTKLSRDQVAEQIQQRFERFKQGELTLQSKQRLLEKRNEGLTAALTMLDKMRHRKAELELKVESLAAQCRLVRASAIESSSTVEASRLSEADQLLSQLETRLAVAQRIITHEQDDQIEFDVEPVNEQQVLLEYDQYFENVDADKEPLGPSGVKLTVQNE